MKNLTGLLFLCVFCCPTMAQTMPAVPRDTSFTIYRAYQKEKKKYPFIKVAAPVYTPAVGVKVSTYKSLKKRKLNADIYYPYRKADDKYPVVLMLHGGGWKSGDKGQMEAMGLELARNGFVAIGIEYRLSPEAIFPAGMEDVSAAIKWIKRNTAAYQADTARIAVLGVSSGGQMAALQGSKNSAGGDTNVQAVVDIDGILAFKHPESEEGKVAAEWLGGTYEEKPLVWQEASALTHAGKTMPPTLFINSQFIRFHAGRDALLEKIKPYNVYTEIHTIADTPHTFWLFEPWFDTVMGYVVVFLEKIFIPNEK